MSSWKEEVQDTTTKMRLLMSGNQDAKKMLIQAMRGKDHVPSGVSFKVEDLFDPYFWKTVDTGIRRELGRAFSAEALKEGSGIVIDETKSGSKSYKKI